LANRIPLLRYVPGYLRTVNVWADDELRLFRGALAEFKQRQRSDPNVPACFAGFLLENQASLELDNDDIAYLLGSVFGAGSDTSSSAIAITIMAAATHRAEADAVRTELDALPEPPTFADLDDATALPRLRAFVAETFRWRPVSSGGFAHATAELTYASKAGNEYVIPEGTTIIGNHWGLARDTAYYGEDVEAFRPSRWIREDGSFNDKMKTHQFGFGRRICPGQHVALNSVLINAALLLWAFEIGEVKGKAIDTLAFTNTANSHPLPFAVQWKARKEVPCEEES
jgi:cytochrome P450